MTTAEPLHRREAYPEPSSTTATRIMRANRSVDTRPELALRSALHAAGLRFRKSLSVPLPGRRATQVDIAFPRARLAVFLDGCFWHGCPSHGSYPKANGAYWRAKLARNAQRDREVDAALEGAGWSVIRVWEHEAPDEAVDRVASAYRSLLSGRQRPGGTKQDAPAQRSRTVATVNRGDRE